MKTITVIQPIKNEIEYTSVSGETSLQSLLPVTLPENERLEFEAILFPWSATKSRTGFITTRAHYFDLCKYLHEVSGPINLIFSTFRYIIYQQEFLSSKTVQERQYYIKKYTSDLLNQLNPPEPEDDKKKVPTMSQMYLAKAVTGLGSGKAIVIKESSRYKGGFDIIFSGIPHSTVISSPIGSEMYDVPDNENARDYTEIKQKYDSELGQLVTKAATKILQVLLDDVSATAVENSYVRHFKFNDLEFSYKKAIQTAVASAKLEANGIDISLLIDALPTVPNTLVKSLGKYFSAFALLEPNKFALDKKIYNPDRPIETLGVSQHALVLQPYLGFSFCISLPRSFAEYISQAEKGKEPSLMCLNTWATIWARAMVRLPGKGRKGERSFSDRQVPRYVISPTIVAGLSQKRKELGFLTENTRANEDGIYVANNGAFNFCPSLEEMPDDNAKNYEKLMDEALRLSFEAGSPLNASQLGETHKLFRVLSPEYGENISKVKENLRKYAGAGQVYSWDYNCILTSSTSEPDKLVGENIAGASRPDDLNLYDYLKKPFYEAMPKLFPRSVNTTNKEIVKDDDFGKYSGIATGLLNTSVFKNTLDLYCYLLHDQVVPGFASLVSETAKVMNIKALTDDSVVDFEKDLYSDIIENNLNVKVQALIDNDPQKFHQAFNYILSKVLKDASGHITGNLAKYVALNNIQVEDEPHYFDSSKYTLAEFKNIYSYFGGRLFQIMLSHLVKTDRKVLMKINVENPLKPVPFLTIVSEVMPFAIMLSKYIPNSDAIQEKAFELIEKNKKDDSITEQDIKIPGAKKPVDGRPGLQMFPHQVETHKYLRNHPRFAVLDISPGGGKTNLGITDIACLVAEGLVKKPLVIAPNNLVKNWVEDGHKFLDGNWNIIPITTATYREWTNGTDRLTPLIQNAPINTIVVVGSTAIDRLDKYPIVIGDHVEIIPDVLEFVKKFKFDYVICDESHRVRNFGSLLHKSLKQLCTCTSTKFVRLATGTLIFNRLTDVCGQAAMFSSQIFRSVDEYEAENSERVGDSRVFTWKKDTPRRAREKLAEYSAVITFKRKEWAFLLPVPIETFIPVRMEKDEAEGGNAHQLMYNAILEKTLEDIKRDKNIRKLLAGKDSDDEDSEETAEETSEEQEELPDLDETTMLELEAALHPYLQRLEMMLTDPLGDEFGEIYFQNMPSFTSNKVLKIVERIKLNFVDKPWSKGHSYNPKDEVDFEGQRYVLMPNEKHDMAENYASRINPDKDPRWKPEPRGKVIVFCRYTRSVKAIYRALPPELKKLAIQFAGSEEKNKYDKLEQFKQQPFSTSKGMQILIANEMSISEGQNLQAASRLIRCEAPWSPGELDQAASRIFRPDPSGKFSRENVYLDWVVTNGSMEIPKLGRLVSKMVSKAQFDEAGNYEYYGNLLDLQLPLIRMNLELFSDVKTLGDISEYLEAYQGLVTAQSTEFKDMRKTRVCKMLDVEAAPMMPGSDILENVPILPDQDIPDRHGFGLVRLNKYLDDIDDPDVQSILEDPKRLIGRNVITEYGPGVIFKVSARNAGKTKSISRVYVKLATNEDYDASATKIHLATNLTDEMARRFKPKSKWTTKKDKEAAAKIQKELEKQQKREERKQQTVKPKVKPQPQIQVPAVNLYPVIYNGFLALEAESETSLKKFGFKNYGDYAYIHIQNYPSFVAVNDFLAKKFYISRVTQKRLDTLENSFKTRGAKKFDVTLAPITELKNFLQVVHKPSDVDKESGKIELKVYPLVLEDSLMLTVDISTNPHIKRLLNKPIKGCTTQFDEASGYDIMFFNTKGEIVRKVKELMQAGFKIENLDEVKTTVDDMAARVKNLR